ncbi:uncharacterized protein EV422DRAFT_509134 [Fimicolochytrium jonesii]|uniref:uncharacterized protein n=1 Tax=Fimicolochytrium jonesii TaxID=1396493 RepID=UPI0022FE5D18|nr:uncharacterized protein EV422DRAFT_509134 [Fimicolochytrium jonesii]KAI8817308.1 hypothetical protein EV422DRAFT_509134 [Fimicolochytrium jonesii]
MYGLRKTRKGFIVEAVKEYSKRFDDLTDISIPCNAEVERNPFDSGLNLARLTGPAPKTIHTGDAAATLRFLEKKQKSESRFERASRGVLRHYLLRYQADPLKYTYAKLVIISHKDRKGKHQLGQRHAATQAVTARSPTAPARLSNITYRNIQHRVGRTLTPSPSTSTFRQTRVPRLAQQSTTAEDATVQTVVENTIFGIHTSALKKVSKHFVVMFTGPWRESQGSLNISLTAVCVLLSHSTCNL